MEPQINTEIKKDKIKLDFKESKICMLLVEEKNQLLEFG